MILNKKKFDLVEIISSFVELNKYLIKMMAVNKEIETMIFEYDQKRAEAKTRLNNIRRIKRDKCVSKIIDKMKLTLENKQ